MRVNWDVLLIRIVFTGILIAAGYFLRPIAHDVRLSVLAAAALAVAIIFFETRVRRASLKTLIGAAMGSILGIIGATLIGFLITVQGALPPDVRAYVTLALLLLMAYVGLMVGAAKGEFLDLSALGGLLRERSSRNVKILDTSVIIDGRIADIVETGFLEGMLVIPNFILRELQQIADSPDTHKRNRGRRGLDILQKLQTKHGITVQFSEVDFPELRDVDQKLIELAKQLDAKIVTNDFNLNKVAQLRGVEVLNINELANALKPVVLPGETMRVFILKEGKEANQGVAYLDDGTMVVVDNARKMIGKTIEATVTSVLQTTAGKMIFGRYVEDTRSTRGSRSSQAAEDS
ncbi:MAG: TRAM domain-containing protein [Blastocatellia bacterium]|nr:TRAM domain-containing protein [Blastocatellia bacterium]MCX7753232.1 TRAM domain-containing protein [Blastocatellia bacterium]MDW8255436.1 TRAM domain-containing protein [Acidobacteriota bacterium]